MGFTHTHLSGTGCGDLLDFLVMPRTGEVKLVPGTREHPEPAIARAFSHDDETAEPGYYSVLLKDPGIRAELTATERTGLHRYTFPGGAKDAHFIVDLIHAYQARKIRVNAAELTIDPENRLVTGGRTVNSWAHGPPDLLRHGVLRPSQGAALLRSPAGRRQPVQRQILKAALHFDPPAGQAVQVRTGISGVSAEALKNLHAEQSDWDFAATRAQPKPHGSASSAASRSMAPRPTSRPSSTPRSTT